MIAAGVNLPATTSSTVGVITQSGSRLMHTFGTSNFFAGTSAGNFTMTGGSNTASGASALFSNTTGGFNTASGTFALNSNTTGAFNTASGDAALLSNTTGNFNTAIGGNALNSNTTGFFNTASGANALDSNTTGSSNIALGEGAGDLLTTGDNNIDIGHRGLAAEADTIRIGTAGDQTRAFVAGIRGITTGVANGITVLIDSSGQLGTVSSSRRYKEDIADMGDASARLQALRPVTFRYKKPYADGGKPVQFGLIAEEVAEVFPELAVFNDEGQPETVKYHDLTPMLLNEVQKLRAEKDALEKRLEKLEKLMNAPTAANI